MRNILACGGNVVGKEESANGAKSKTAQPNPGIEAGGSAESESPHEARSLLITPHLRDSLRPIEAANLALTRGPQGWLRCGRPEFAENLLTLLHKAIP